MNAQPIFRELPGLPPYGALAIPIPTPWGALGREGKVVEFTSAVHSWIGKFQPGLGRIDVVLQHPDGNTVIVVAGGATYLVNPSEPSKVTDLGFSVDGYFVLEGSGHVVLQIQELEFIAFDANGVWWRSRRISWDGFRELKVEGEVLSGLAWDAGDSINEWKPFSLSLCTGEVVGGSYPRDDRPAYG